MDFTRWKFSKHVEPELQEFLKIVQNNKKNYCGSENKTWEQILPKPTSLYELESSNVELNDIITIEDDEDEIVLEESESKANVTNIPDILNSLSLSDPSQLPENELINFKNSLKECLNDNRLLEEGDIKKISLLNNELVIELILYLKENVCDNGLLKLGESFNCLSLNDQIIRQYCKILLNKLLNTETSITFMPVVSLFIKNYPSSFKEEISLPLLNEYLHSHVFEEIYKLLSQTEKDNLIRDFLFSCNDLQEGHLILLQPIIPQISEFSVKQRLINLMSSSADKFKDSKIYMKILIEIIKTLNKDYLELEPILYGIVEKNKTIFKISAEKALNAWFNSWN